MLKQLIDLAGVPVQRLAHNAGTHPNTIRHMLADPQRVPRADTLRLLAEELAKHTTYSVREVLDMLTEGYAKAA